MLLRQMARSLQIAALGSLARSGQTTMKFTSSHFRLMSTHCQLSFHITLYPSCGLPSLYFHTHFAHQIRIIPSTRPTFINTPSLSMSQTLSPFGPYGSKASGARGRLVVVNLSGYLRKGAGAALKRRQLAHRSHKHVEKSADSSNLSVLRRNERLSSINCAKKAS